MKKLLGWLLLVSPVVGAFVFIGYDTGYLNTLIALGKALLVVSALAAITAGALLIAE